MKLPFFVVKRCRRRQQIKKDNIVNKRKMTAPIVIDE